MYRRSWVIAAVGAALLTMAPVATHSPRAHAARRRPNILIIVTDDQRGGISVMPRTRRKFIRKGRTLKRGMVTTPLCCPSRASIFSGLYTHNHGVHDNFTAEKLDQKHTLQRYLKRSGYKTGYFGKYFNFWPISRKPPHFGRWSIFSGKDPGYYYDGRWNVNGRVRRIHEYATTFIGDKAEKFLEGANRRRDRKPWLMFVAPTAPHHPYVPERRYRHARISRWGGNPAVREKDRSDKPPYVRTKHATLRVGRRIRRKQFRTLKSVDNMIGRVFRTMRRLRENRSTLAIFISDNGYMWAEHGLGGKRHAYSPSYQVPFMMRWPGHLRRGSVERRYALNIDIAPTVLDAARLKPPVGHPMDGKSLFKKSWTRPRVLLEYGPDPPHPTWAALRTKGYQYTEYYEKDGTTVKFREYYNMRRDPWQLRNLLRDGRPGNNPAVAALHAQLAADRQCKSASCP